MKNICLCLVFLLGCKNISNKSSRVNDTIKNKAVTIRVVDTVIIGKAEYFEKTGAYIINDNNVYYMNGIDVWNVNVRGEILKVSGKMLVQDLDPGRFCFKDTVEIEDDEKWYPDKLYFCDNIPEQRIYGIKFTIMNPQWELLDTFK